MHILNATREIPQGEEMKMEKKVNYIEALRTAFNGAENSIKEAASIVVAAIDEDPVNKDRLIEAFPHIPYTTWATFERIGRGQMDYRLAMGGGTNAGMIKRLPMSDQKNIMDGVKLPLVTFSGDTLLVDPRNCTPAQAKQLIDGDCLRSEGDQRAYMEDQERQIDIMEKAQPRKVTVRRGMATFSACTMTKNEILDVLRDMA
jgi:hypothetical protein